MDSHHTLSPLLKMRPYTPPLSPMHPNRHTHAGSLLAVKVRPLDRLARILRTLVIGEDVQPVERERPAAPVDADVVAAGTEFHAVEPVYLRARAEMVSFAGVVRFAVGADPAIVRAFFEGGVRGVGGGGGGGGGWEGESACAQEGEEDGLELHFR